jgi:hypothetical protein
MLMKLRPAVKFGNVVVLAIMIGAICFWIVFPYWDQQMRDLFEQQKEECHAQHMRLAHGKCVL